MSCVVQCQPSHVLRSSLSSQIVSVSSSSSTGTIAPATIAPATIAAIATTAHAIATGFATTTQTFAATVETIPTPFTEAPAALFATTATAAHTVTTSFEHVFAPATQTAGALVATQLAAVAIATFAARATPVGTAVARLAQHIVAATVAIAPFATIGIVATHVVAATTAARFAIAIAAPITTMVAIVAAAAVTTVVTGITTAAAMVVKVTIRTIRAVPVTVVAIATTVIVAPKIPIAPSAPSAPSTTRGPTATTAVDLAFFNALQRRQHKHHGETSHAHGKHKPAVLLGFVLQHVKHEGIAQCPLALDPRVLARARQPLLHFHPSAVPHHGRKFHAHHQRREAQRVLPFRWVVPGVVGGRQRVSVRVVPGRRDRRGIDVGHRGVLTVVRSLAPVGPVQTTLRHAPHPRLAPLASLAPLPDIFVKGIRVAFPVLQTLVQRDALVQARPIRRQLHFVPLGVAPGSACDRVRRRLFGATVRGVRQCKRVDIALVGAGAGGGEGDGRPIVAHARPLHVFRRHACFVPVGKGPQPP